MDLGRQSPRHNRGGLVCDETCRPPSQRTALLRPGRPDKKKRRLRLNVDWLCYVQRSFKEECIAAAMSSCTLRFRRFTRGYAVRGNASLVHRRRVFVYDMHRGLELALPETSRCKIPTSWRAANTETDELRKGRRLVVLRKGRYRRSTRYRV